MNYQPAGLARLEAREQVSKQYLEGNKYQEIESHEAHEIDLMASNIDDEALKVREINRAAQKQERLTLPQEHARGKPKKPRAQFQIDLRY